jgi:putative DNA primase/helicase
MSKNEKPASGGTLDGADISNIAGRDGGINNTATVNIQSKPMLDAALAYAARGWNVFPVPIGTKKSHKAARVSGSKWGATTDAYTINHDFTKWSDANVGIATGPDSGIFVLDVDTIAGHGVDGIASLMTLVEENGPLPETLRAQSPSGSCHFYFNYPVDIELRKSEGKVGPGLDVQAMLAIVIAPPSVKGTSRYSWQNAGTPIVDAPDWLIEKCIEVEINEAELTISERAMAAMGARTEFAPGSREEKRTASWLAKAFDEEVKLVASTKLGRNPQLFKSVKNIAGYLVNGAPGIHAADIRNRFFEAMIVNGSIKDNGRAATLATIRSALEGTTTPRRWPDFSSLTGEPELEPEGAGSEDLAPGTGDDEKDSDVTEVTDRPTPTPQPQAPLNSEMDLSNSFVTKHEQTLRYVSKWGSWMIWSGSHWAFDHTMRAFDLSRFICREAARKCNVPSEAKSLASAKTVAAVLSMSRAYRVMSATVEQWDVTPMLFNDTLATVDLRTGNKRTPERTDYMTKMAGTLAAPQGTKHPIWTQFLNRITDNDRELARFLQRYVGYCMTGEVKEHVFVFAYGTGANGKGVFLNTIVKVFGEYAVVADMATFIESKNDRHPTDVAKLCGSRLVVAQETQQGRPWDEAKIKAITGGDKQTARFMRQDFFDFFPTFKLFIVGNHKPTLKNVDEAMKRRLLLVPFTVQIPLTERDPTLADRLEAEWPAILRWAIDGCLEWQRSGLKPPKVVTDATAEYFAAEDGFGLWLEEACEVDPGNKWKSATAGDLFASWTSYAVVAGIEPGTAKAFAELLINRGAEFVRTGKDRTRTYQGISLLNAIDPNARTEAAEAKVEPTRTVF